MPVFEVRGLPLSLQNDAWWLSDGLSDTQAPGKTPPPSARSLVKNAHRPNLLIALVSLLLLADTLFWQHPVGVSLAIFGLALGLMVWLTSKRGFKGGEGIVGICLLGVPLIPVIEQINTLSVLFFVAGMAAFTVWSALRNHATAKRMLEGMMRFASAFPLAACRDFWTFSKKAAQGQEKTFGWEAFRNAWALPVIVGLVFVMLLVAANPVMQAWIDAILTLRTPTSTLGRLTFWTVMAAFIWPFLVVRRLLRGAPTRRFELGRGAYPPGRLGINPTSISNSLFMFNLIFAVQTGLDVLYLWSGADLPQGVSHAQYAHRGAYPLVATALLAGVFAMISRPFTEGNKVLRLLLVLWIGQNLLLVLSSLYRLELYVTAFGLTYLRVAAGIWMGLVATGLALTAWQLWKGFCNTWLLKKNAIVLVCVLFACSFVNFAHVIAATNLGQIENSDRKYAVDFHYLCGLGPMSAGAIHAYNIENSRKYCRGMLADARQISHGWRDWGFRSWRVQGYLAANAIR